MFHQVIYKRDKQLGQRINPASKQFSAHVKLEWSSIGPAMQRSWDECATEHRQAALASRASLAAGHAMEVLPIGDHVGHHMTADVNGGNATLATLPL